MNSTEKYCGIENPGSACYIIALVQQLWSWVSFRTLLLKDYIPEEKEMLNVLQKLFIRINSSESHSINADDLLTKLTTDRNSIDDPQDISQYLSRWLKIIKQENVNGSILEKFVHGELMNIVSTTESSSMQELRKEYKLSPFNYISVAVGKHGIPPNDLVSSFYEFTKVYSFSNCDNLTNHVRTITKQTLLKSLPMHLIIHLKRFDINHRLRRVQKTNSYFEFPLSNIDLSPYIYKSNITLQDFDKTNTQSVISFAECIYELEGIVIHKGTAEQGHYYSIVRDACSDQTEGHDIAETTSSQITIEANASPPLVESICSLAAAAPEVSIQVPQPWVRRWIKLDDHKVEYIDERNIPAIAFGCNESEGETGVCEADAESAYMLFYKRVKM